MWVHTHKLKARRSTQRVKNDPHRFCYLKWPCNSYIFKICQKHLHLGGKTETFKIAVFFPTI